MHWHLLLLLLNIINIVFSYSITEGMTVYLKHLIIEHHQLFKELYPSKNFIPKHHFMVHYPRCIRKIGPLIHIWTMRFEAKRKFFKDCVKNFKNLTVSFAKKHQFAVAYHWECFSSKAVESGPVKQCLLETLDYTEDIAAYLHIDSQATIRLSNWVKCGAEYCVGLFVCTGTDENMPVFSKIISIILHDGKVVFVSVEHETCFHDHFHAFQISENIPKKILVLEMDRLRHFKCFDAQMSYGCDSHLYVVSFLPFPLPLSSHLSLCPSFLLSFLPSFLLSFLPSFFYSFFPFLFPPSFPFVLPSFFPFIPPSFLPLLPSYTLFPSFLLSLRPFFLLFFFLPSFSLFFLPSFLDPEGQQEG